MRIPLLAAGRACLLLFIASTCASQTSLETIAERSGFRTTGRYDEVERLCDTFAQTWQKEVRCVEFGRTPEGRRMLALIITRTGALTPEEARERGIPVLLMQGGIHAGEIDGKDAGFLAVRRLLRGEAAPRALESIVLVFVPVFNVDGHERFKRWNRPNQNGPEEMGWRVTSQNLNLNRDYAKADTPEMQAMLRLLDAWDPILYADLHATDGAEFEHGVSNAIEPRYTGDPQLQVTGRALLAEINRRVARDLPVDFYPSFVDSDDPASGFRESVYPPRFSTGYWPLRNRFTLLVETHSWKDYRTRVRITYDIIVALAELTATKGREWRAQAREADERASRIGGQEVVLDFDTAPESRTIEFRGYAYTREPSAISGALATRYDVTKPQIWRVPLWDKIVPKITVRAPRAGYIVPAAHATWMAERLSLHGIRFERLERPVRGATVETFRATSVSFGKRPFEGRMTAALDGQWREEKRELPAGSLFVPVSQPKARLVLALLEPQAPDSFVAWGFFNSAFEQKEYMEAYVAEQVARDMLASDPEIAAAFRAKLAKDPEFAKDPQARLQFFYQRHPSWDERLNLYPVYRVSSRPSR